jgi:hypothetical protein
MKQLANNLRPEQRREEQGREAILQGDEDRGSDLGSRHD